MKKRKNRRGLWILLIILSVIAAGLSAGLIIDAPNRREIRDLSIADVNFEGLQDGTYVGCYDGGKSKLRAAQVRVTVDEGAVTAIEAVEGGGDSEMIIEDLFGRVIGAQSLRVDTVTGATLTSKAHLKAVEYALNKAQ